MNNLPPIMGITAGAALLLGFQLFFHRANKTANRWLGIFLATLGVAMLEIFLVSQNFHVSHSKWFEIMSLSRFLTAPALYLSIRSYTSLNKGFRPSHLLHFIPFAVFTVFRLPFFITGKNFEFTDGTAVIVFFILRMALPVQSLIYWGLSLRKLTAHAAHINEFSSSVEKTDLSWLKNFLWTLGILLFTWFNLIFFGISAIEEFTAVIYLFCIFFLSYFAFRQKEVYDYGPKELAELSGIIEEASTPLKTRQKRLSDTRMQELDSKLQIAIADEKMFLENELTLPVLASTIGCTANELSYLINELYQENFYSFINRHRVEEAKSLLLSEQFTTLNVIGIAYQSGFNSKTTFNTMFKKQTGLSPTAFVKKHSSTIA